MNEETQSRRPRFIVMFFAAVALLVGGWHYHCVQLLKARVNTKMGEIRINPLTNTVYARMNTKKLDGLAMLGAALFSRQAETYLEMELDKKVHEYADVYAMLVPYRVRLTME